MTPPETPAPVAPNASLALIVANKLKDQAYIPEEKVNDISRRLELGTATAQDWRLWIELALQNKTAGGANG